MDDDPFAWLDSLPPALQRQRMVLRRLLTAVARDPHWRFLALSASVARGAADADSDLDMALGVRDDAWPRALEDIPALMSEGGAMVDLLSHRLPEWGDRPHRRTFVQYADGAQVDLVAYPAAMSRGRPPHMVVLYDPDERLAEPWVPSVYRADAAVREWTFLGWTALADMAKYVRALADMAKYVRRGSPWEALERLRQARASVWRLWAVARSVEYPAFGLTSVFDDPAAGLPEGIETTVAGLDHHELRHAALACATLLERTAALAAPVVDAKLPAAMAGFVRRQLEALPDRPGSG